MAADVLPIEPEDIATILRDVRQADIDEIVEGPASPWKTSWQMV